MQSEMQKEINNVKEQISEIEKQIKIAKKTNSGVEELQNELNQLKQQLAMMEQAMNYMAVMPDSLIQEAENTNDGNNGIPKLDKGRIKQIPDKILSDTELAVFITNIQLEIEKKILPIQKTQAALMLSKAKEKDLSSAAIGTMASLCWMNGYAEIAIYLMDSACLSDVKNPDNLNNLSAFLTMTGGEHLALPILDNLNAKYPNNSTILNNIGQAWFGLGDVNNAKKYIEKAVMFYAIHSQANQTLAQIYKSEGKTGMAIQAIKNSMKKSYSSEKEAILNDLGETMAYDEMVWKYPKPAGEPLGLNKFLAILPEYPMSVADVEEINADWITFYNQISEAKEKLEKEIEQLKKDYEAFEKKLRDPAKQYAILMAYNNPVYNAANRKLLLFAEWYGDKAPRVQEKRNSVRIATAKLNQEYREAMEKADDCPKQNAAANKLLKTANQLWHDVQLEWVNFEKQAIQEKIGYLMYASVDKSFFELAKAKAKNDFLIVLGALQYEYAPPCVLPVKKEGKRGKLPDFDDVNCQYKTELSIPMLEDKFSIKVECNKMTTKFDLPFVKAEMVENLNTNKLVDVVKGTVEISQGFSKEIPMEGPIKAEIEAKVGAFVEFNNSGISDVGVTGEAGVKMETQMSQKVEFGVGVRSGWNSGTSVSGTGIFQGSSVSYK